jgi:glycosidase
MPGIPFIHYGDEIGLRQSEGLPSKEGGYSRTGARTPMQWNASENLGFSTAAPGRLYLPIDLAPDAPTVEREEQAPGSLLRRIKGLIRLRRQNPALSNDGLFTPLYAEAWKYPFVYSRAKDGQTFVIAINPSGAEAKAEFALDSARELRLVHGDKVPHTLTAGRCAMTMAALSFGIYEISTV